ncbi:fatty acid desaturase family protein [Salinarimonas ramus]|uniref:Fatty acid desaturase domain-containing protein n=1 Tax=Salinarimonas ramus TaxID=690164 RepID=A0A917V317_9HYPH|nr:fatty acid desaturase [Salinarimonas ramus]GGK27918.1 hypothetical protein GCM10011322_13060 [Salinarimonas ramus]
MTHTSTLDSISQSNRDAKRQARFAAVERTPLRLLAVYAFTLTLTVILAAGTLIAFRHVIPGPLAIPAVAGAMIMLGLFYAHFTELQHELLHGHAFRSQGVSRALGVVCGLPMLISYSHYRFSHLRHHALLGTAGNKEFFDYPKRGLDSPGKLLLAAMSPGRFVTLASRIANAFLGRQIDEDARNHRTHAQIRSDYILFGSACGSRAANSAAAWTSRRFKMRGRSPVSDRGISRGARSRRARSFAMWRKASCGRWRCASDSRNQSAP